MTKLLAAVAILLAAWLALRWMAGRSLYYPLRDGRWELRQALGAEDIWLHATDGTRLHAWWIPVAGARVATLYLHGNGGNVTHRADHIREITAAGSSLLILDYRGYGKSEGRPHERGLYQDADAGYDWLRKRGAGRIVAHGESLGSAVAVDLAARRPCAGVVLEAPFPSARQVAGRVLPLLGPLLVGGFDSGAKIQRIHAPLLVIHGDQDEVIAYGLGELLFRAANDPKTLWTVRGGRHNDLVFAAGPEYRRRLEAFYAALAG